MMACIISYINNYTTVYKVVKVGLGSFTIQIKLQVTATVITCIKTL